VKFAAITINTPLLIGANRSHTNRLHFFLTRRLFLYVGKSHHCTILLGKLF